MKEEKEIIIKEDVEPKYNIKNYILFFFTFSFIGWIWEVLLFLFNTGKFTNRGVLLGPYLPIYGSGGIAILLLLKKFYKKPILTFVLSMTICSVIEYFTSWYLEFTTGLRWWDYSQYFLNINGRICLEGSLIFGFAGCLVIYLLAPKLKKLYNKINIKLQIISCTVFLIIFIIDVVYSNINPNTGEGITDYEKWNQPVINMNNYKT